MRAAALGIAFVLCGCGRYRDFILPLEPGSETKVAFEWKAAPEPVLSRGAPGEWDAGDVLNPSIVKANGVYFNLYSGFLNTTWRSGLATSRDGLHWEKRGAILAPDATTWEGDDYIAANGSLVSFRGDLLYYYQAGRTARIGLAKRVSERDWRKQAGPVLDLGPRGAWDERGVADPYVFERDGKLYLFYNGMDRARRQRLGVAVSEDGLTWSKLRDNPILELGAYGDFDENGLGEPAVWASSGFYWMLYTGRDRGENRRLGLAQSNDGVHWRKLKQVFAGDQPWDAKVLCDPTVLVENGEVRVWFGGGDVARPDENIHGQIGYAVLRIHTP
jgi:predicted GH43/DUF377 family glycosyl hydrolase